MPVFEVAYTSYLHKTETAGEFGREAPEEADYLPACFSYSTLQPTECTCEWTQSLTTVSHWYEPRLVNEPYQYDLFHDWAIHLQLKFLQSVKALTA